MSLEKLKQAKQLEILIENQENCLRYFQNGKISKISVRQFNNHNCEFEEEDFSENIPRAQLKQLMLDYLKKDIENLNNKLANLFKP